MLPHDLKYFTAPRAPWMTLAMLALFACALAIPEAEGQRSTAQDTNALSKESVSQGDAAYSAPTCPRTHPWGWERLRLMVAHKTHDADNWAVQCFYGSYYSATARFAP